MDKNEFTPLTNLEHQIAALEVAIYNLKQANTPHLNTHTKKMLTSIIQNLINTKNEIRKSVNELSDERKTYIQKMLQGSKSLCEENGNLVKGIVDTHKTSEEQIAEDFVEKFLPENFVEDYLNKQ